MHMKLKTWHNINCDFHERTGGTVIYFYRWCLRYIWKYYPAHNSNIRRKDWRYQIGYQKRTSKDRQYNGQTKENRKTKQWSKKLYNKLEIERHETHKKQGLNLDGPEGYAVLTGTRRVTLVTNPRISHEWRKKIRLWYTINGIYYRSFMT